MSQNPNSLHQIEGLLYSNGKPVSVTLQDGLIVDVKRISVLPDKSRNVFIAPGLIDNQVNGFNGISFWHEEGKGVIDKTGIFIATKALWQSGVTTYLPTLITAGHPSLIRNFTAWARVQHDAAFLGSVAGFHLEGPYISPVAGYRGAHSEKYIRDPDWNEFMELYQASGNSILTVTVAPEIPGGLEFIKKCQEKGIIVALGHHNASAGIIDQAVEMGARICTHLGNGLANTINRHVNPLWPQLANDKLMISIICDGFHLLPEEIRVFYKVKGADKIILTSDVTMFAGMPPGIYKNEADEDIELAPDGLLHYPAQGVLYGSACPLNTGLGHIMKVTGCPLSEAIQMASTNPARLLRLEDRGEIEPGKRADLILFTIEAGRIIIQQTIVAGKTVYLKRACNQSQVTSHQSPL